MTTVEPEWDLEQLALLSASERIEADRGPHGHPMSEATSPDADPARPGGWYYSAGNAPFIDFAQQAIDRARESHHKANPDADSAGHVWKAEKIYL